MSRRMSDPHTCTVVHTPLEITAFPSTFGGTTRAQWPGMRSLIVFCLVLTAACTTHRGAIEPVSPTSPSPPALAAAPPAVLRIESTSISCEQVVSMQPDGGATLLCTDHDDGCVLRALGPDGEVRTTGDRIPGQCRAYWPRAAGGGFVATNDDEHLHATITAVDAQGHAGASLTLSSVWWAYVQDGVEADDGGLFVALQVRSDLTLRARRLAFGNYFIGVVLRLPPTLADVTWTRVFETSEAHVTNLLRATQAGGVDALVSFHGTLRAAEPSLSASGKRGWITARVAIDAAGKPFAQREVARDATLYGMQTADGSLAIMTPGSGRPPFNNVMLVAGDGTHGALTPVKMRDERVSRLGERAWLIECDCDLSKQPVVGPSRAIELGGAGRIELAGTVGNGMTEWKSVVTQGTRAVGLGTSVDARTGIAIAFVAMGDVAGGKLDVSQMRVADHLVLAPGCGPRTKPDVRLASLVDGNAFAACKLPSQTLAQIALWPEGGVRSLRVSVPNSTTWSLDDSTTACVRKVIEPALACPPLETNLSSGISYDLRSKP
jgi:hypothetical protein